MQTTATRCCFAGGGPAGMMLGLLLARAGVDVTVLEKHGDFLRDFRGDTIHPSTLEIMHELGFLEEFLRLPHQEVRELGGQVGDLPVTIADFTHLPVRSKFIAIMPQWDFLDFLARKARAYPGFHLLMRAKAKRLVERDGRVAGLVAETDAGKVQIDAPLVIGADGRHSTVRQAAGLAVQTLGAPMDVLWFRLSRRPDDAAETMGRFDSGRIFVLINRGEHWQCGYVIAKDSLARVKAAGLEAFRAEVARLAPFAADRIGEIASWDDVKLLTVGVDRLRTWYRPGLLCIGDAAHTMSPVGGVGINLAVQDAVAAANILAVKLADGRVTDADLAAVQARRACPTRMTQRLQLLVQRRVIGRVLERPGPIKPPLAVRLLARCPFLRRIPARLIGLGVRPEHVRSPARH
ncbi:MAG: FAD-dependent oxidoreductase [Alphaproteobacteria bacterium]|nr:FAD-dependent oxidoreductase [Alphaproteobacteria bacterium]